MKKQSIARKPHNRSKKQIATVTAYINTAPQPSRIMLRKLRAVIRLAAPRAEEKISYGMPYFGYHGRLIYFAAFTRHVSIFPMMSTTTRRKYLGKLKPYLSGRVTMHVPLGEKIPYQLIVCLVKARIREVDALRKSQ